MRKSGSLFMIVLGALCACGVESNVFDSMLTPEAVRLKKMELAGESIPMPSAMVRSVSTLSASPLRLNIKKVSQVAGTKGEETVIEVIYDLLGTSNLCKVAATFMTNGVPVPSYNLSDDIGVGVHPDTGLCLRWAAGKDCPNIFSDKVQVKLTVTEIDIPAEWANVMIEWGSYGGKDIDICAYWSDAPHERAGFGQGYPSNGYDTLKWPSEDNTRSGPETLQCDVGGRTSRSLCVHFNYYNTAGNPPNVKVTAKNNGQTKSLVSSAGVRSGSKALTSDPGVVIVFDENNNPISISSL